MGLLVVLSCNQKPKSSAYDDDEEEETEELKLKTFTFSEKEGIAHVDLSIQFPVRGDEELVDAIRQYLADQVGLESDEVELSDGKGMANYYGQKLMDDMRQLAQDYAGDDYVTEVYHDWKFSKLYETDDYVTFLGETDLYEGGVHGINYQNGITFFEDNGKHLTTGMLRNTDSEDFQELMRDGLKQYFDVSTDEELAEELISVEDVYSIPLPSADPYAVKEGIVFIYQPYEISYYGAGMPAFTIPLKKMKPFLNREALKGLDLN